MISFKEYKQIKEQTNDLLLVLLMSEDIGDEINEANIEGTINTWLNKVGLKIHKTNGLVQLLKRFTSTSGKLLLAALKKDKEEIKKIASEIDKTTFMKFILNLDMITMHLLTGPIHMIAAVTGWEIETNPKEQKEAKNYINIFYKSIESLRTSIKNLVNPKKAERLLVYTNKIEKNIPYQPK